MLNCNFKSIDARLTQHLPLEEAILIAAKIAVAKKHQGVAVRCKAEQVYKSDPPTKVVKLVNLNVYNGIRSDHPKIHRAVPGGLKVFLLNIA